MERRFKETMTNNYAFFRAMFYKAIDREIRLIQRVYRIHRYRKQTKKRSILYQAMNFFVLRAFKTVPALKARWAQIMKQSANAKHKLPQKRTVKVTKRSSSYMRRS